MILDTVDYAVAVHRLYDNGNPKHGGLDRILDQLITKNKTILYVECPLVISEDSSIFVTARTKAKSELISTLKLHKNPFVARIQEVLFLLFLPIKYKIATGVYFTSDPLTTFPILLMRKLGFVRFSYYHCIDYSVTRFSNPALNFVYKFVMNICLRNVDLVGVVTHRIEELIKEQQVKKIIYVPNSPSVAALSTYIVPIDHRDRYSFVMTCAGLSEKYRVTDTIKLFGKILDKYPNATLTIVGSKNFNVSEYTEISAFIEKLQFKAKIFLTGQLTTHENFLTVAKSWIGLAFYDNRYSHVNFGDSLKIREYAALGIPTVADKTTPTAHEMLEWQAGFVVDEPWFAFDFIDNLLSDEKLYQETSRNALQWAKSVDKDKIVEELLTKIGDQT